MADTTALLRSLLLLLLLAIATASELSRAALVPQFPQAYREFSRREISDLDVREIGGDLSDAYNNSVLLDDDQVTFFWTLSSDSISIAAWSKKRSGYLAIGFGDGMVHSYAYVGWMDDAGRGRVSTYWIDGKDASRVHPTGEKLAGARFRSENGLLSLEFCRPLSPSCSGRVECENVIDPSSPLPVVWARGAQWSDGRLGWRNMHAIASDRAVGVLLTQGVAEEVKGVPLALAVHGFLMLASWGVLFPCGMLAARYLKHLERGRWFHLHVRLQFSAMASASLGLLLAAGELGGLVLRSAHAMIGAVAVAMAFAQPANSYLRPKAPAIDEVESRTRILWSYIHCWTGRSAIIVGIVAVLSGLKYVADAYDCESVDGVTWAFMVWVLVAIPAVLLLEYLEMKRRRRERNSFVLRIADDEDCSVDLLHQNRATTEVHCHAPGRREVQLESLNC